MSQTMPKIREVKPENITPPIETLEYYFRSGGVSIIQAAFSHSFFVSPSDVKARSPYFPDRARTSRKYYPGRDRGDTAHWSGGDGRKVVLGDNAYAQHAWQRYTGCPMMRRSGYGLRHIWGHPWDPDAFTAGWNLCYMPFWAGMLTEDQHLHVTLRDAIRQASWDLFFAGDSVCKPPEYVKDPGLNLSSILNETPLLLMKPERAQNHKGLVLPGAGTTDSPSDAFAQVKSIRSETHQSWTNIAKGVLALQRKPHQPFGTPNVEASSKSCVRKICRETGLSLNDLQQLLSSVTRVEDQML